MMRHGCGAQGWLSGWPGPHSTGAATYTGVEDGTDHGIEDGPSADYDVPFPVDKLPTAGTAQGDTVILRCHWLFSTVVPYGFTQ